MSAREMKPDSDRTEAAQGGEADDGQGSQPNRWRQMRVANRSPIPPSGTRYG